MNGIEKRIWFLCIIIIKIDNKFWYFFIFLSFLLLYIFFYWIFLNRDQSQYGSIIRQLTLLIFLSIYFTPIFFITLLIFSFYLLLYSFYIYFFHYINFSTQIGCCKPPLRCGFTKKNATFWEAPKAGPLANDTDCRTWSNRQDKLCFNCDSCKGGVLANIRSQWRHLTIFNTCVLVLVTTIYVLGYYAIRNNRLEYSNYTTQRRKIGMRIPSTVIWSILNPTCSFSIVWRKMFLCIIEECQDSIGHSPLKTRLSLWLIIIEKIFIIQLYFSLLFYKNLE